MNFREGGIVEKSYEESVRLYSLLSGVLVDCGNQPSRAIALHCRTLPEEDR